MLHSKDPDALMAPVYRGYVPNFDLMPDDIRKIQALYGKPESKAKPDKEPKPDKEAKPGPEPEFERKPWLKPWPKPKDSDEEEEEREEEKWIPGDSIESRIAFWENMGNNNI